jgi:hypothetical protein
MGAVASRADLATLLRSRGLTGTAVEVGVWRGDFAYPFMDRWRGKQLILVDPWRRLPDEEYDDVRNRDFDPKDLERVVDKFREFQPHVRVLRGTSIEAARAVHGPLDFVYIDANHRYIHVKQDIELWWPKVRPGGILAGHDLFTLDHAGVTAAVTEFCVAHNLECCMVQGDFNEHGCLVNSPSWYVEKPL